MSDIIVTLTSPGTTNVRFTDTTPIDVSGTLVVENYAALTALPTAVLNDKQAVEVLGHTTAGDNGGGVFWWDAASTATVDGGTILGTGTGRWKRRWDGVNLTAAYFGIFGAASSEAVLANVPDETSEFVLLFGVSHAPGAVTQIARNFGVTVHLDGQRQYRVTQGDYLLNTATVLDGHGAKLTFDCGSLDDAGLILTDHSKIRNLIIDAAQTGYVDAGHNRNQYIITNIGANGGTGQSTTSEINGVVLENITFLPQRSGCKGDGFIQLGGVANLTIRNIYFSGTHVYTEEGINCYWANVGAIPGNNLLIENIKTDSFTAKYPGSGGGALVKSNGYANVTIRNVIATESSGKLLFVSPGDSAFQNATVPKNEWRNSYLIENIQATGLTSDGITLGNVSSGTNWFDDDSMLIVIRNVVLRGESGSRAGIHVWGVQQLLVQNARVSGFGDNIRVTANDSAKPSRNVVLENCICSDGDRGLYTTLVQDLVVKQCWFYDNDDYGAYVDVSTTRPTFIDNRFGKVGGAQPYGLTIASDATITDVVCTLNRVLQADTAGYTFGASATYKYNSFNYDTSFSAQREGWLDGLLRSNSARTFIGTNVTPSFPFDCVAGAARFGADDTGTGSVVRTANTNKDFSFLLGEYASAEFGMFRGTATSTSNVANWGTGQGAYGVTRHDWYVATAVGNTGSAVARLDSSGRWVFGDTTIENSAQVTVNSTTRGFMPPRMTTVQRDAIATPAAGLVIYNTTDSKHQGYDGGTWNNFY